MPSRVLVTLLETQWSGWGAAEISERTAQAWFEAKGTISPEMLGRPRSTDAGTERWFYEVVIERIAGDMVVFAYRNLVVDNPGGGINLSASTSGTFFLRWGETKRLSTPTMDAGIKVAVTVNEIGSP